MKIKNKNKLKIKESIHYNGDVSIIHFYSTNRTITTNRRGYFAICKYINQPHEKNSIINGI
mgnify:CR=1 FL=1